MRGREKMRLDKKMQNKSDTIKVDIRVLKTGLRSLSDVCMTTTVRKASVIGILLCANLKRVSNCSVR